MQVQRDSLSNSRYMVAQSVLVLVALALGDPFLGRLFGCTIGQQGVDTAACGPASRVVNSQIARFQLSY